ncbi:hypothetical protein ACFQHO_32510 [Actinomadura yumaensis]|uniref:hypothetical protein n=1 Tax=Actinomadura yumaensis TaxID=111807 RepID=UPI0036232CA0
MTGAISVTVRRSAARVERARPARSNAPSTVSENDRVSASRSSIMPGTHAIWKYAFVAGDRCAATTIGTRLTDANWNAPPR